MKGTSYRLGEHKINETNGVFWWEAHAGVGGLKSGRCFIRGDILLIGPTESEAPGYLKREFLERLQELPQWDHTRYFSLNYTILDIGSGKKLTKIEISEWAGNQSQTIDHAGPGDRTLTEGTDSAPEFSYKLGQHEIIKKTNGQVWWKTYSGYSSLREGRCVIAGDILFLGAAETGKPSNLKQAFFEHLSQLPQWRATRYYCTSCALYDSRTGENLVEEAGSELPGEVPRPSTKESLIHPIRNTPSHAPFPKPWRPRLYNSSISFQKRVVGKTDSGVEGNPYGVRFKSKRILKSRFIQSCITASKSLMGECPIKRGSAHIGALMQMIGDRVLTLFPGNRKSKDGHSNHGEQSSKHHRGD